MTEFIHIIIYREIQILYMFSLPIVTNLVVNRKEKKEYDIKKDILMPEMGRVLKYQIENSIKC